ncbi:hypothetical protein [Foetidibacter luteolus]|uniref:hypothetical protein n=1 Tax=Foetidibacter luteolus TaxID=2608880 RepID=UPI00129BCCA8|nr:hypothetical protein [Foetidibacter luteolus]
MNKIEVPANEVLQAKEDFFTNNMDLSKKFEGRPYLYLMGLLNLAADAYKKAYESGYRAKELENVINSK